jgi:hypothetical protein
MDKTLPVRSWSNNLKRPEIPDIRGQRPSEIREKLCISVNMWVIHDSAYWEAQEQMPNENHLLRGLVYISRQIVLSSSNADLTLRHDNAPQHRSRIWLVEGFAGCTMVCERQRMRKEAVVACLKVLSCIAWRYWGIPRKPLVGTASPMNPGRHEK